MNGQTKPRFADTESATTSARRDKRELLKLALEEFCARTDAGEQVHREAFLRKYALVADELAECFVSLDFVQHIAPQLADEEPQSASQSPTIQPKASLGDFRILRQLGRGGMGVVFEAEQLSLGRVVALKVLPFASMLDEKQLQRFKNEARAAATLDHPNIISVYGTGQDRGVHYYAMQLIHGQNIAQVIDELRRTAEPGDGAGQVRSPGKPANDVRSGRPALAGQSARTHDPSADPEGGNVLCQAASDPVPSTEDTQPRAALSTERSNNPAEFFRSIARLGRQAAEALDHAHAQGIVHRDVKPANLMLDARGKVYVTDFGLARIDTGAGVTMTGDLVGTLRYMSPEQALAKRVVVDHRTDIYSLGVTLYELLTLRPAFEGDDRQQLLHNISFDEPKPPRSINRAIPTELDTIIRKTIEKNPNDRYATALELADDLGRFLDDKPIHARPPSMWQRTAKWSRRHKPMVASAAVVLILATIGLAIGSLLLAHERNVAQNARRIAQVQQREAELQRDEADQQRAEAERQKTLAEDNFRRARDAVDAYLTRVSEDQLLNVPSLQPLRKDLLELALKYYQEFISERREDVALHADLAAAYYRVGKITSEIGSKEEALKAYHEALAVRKKLVATDPHNPVYQNDLGEDYRSVGWLQFELGGVESARTSLQKAIAVSEQLIEKLPSVGKYRHVLAKSHVNLGILQAQVGDMAASSKSFEKAIEIQQELVEDDPTVLEYQQALANSHNALGLNQLNTGDFNAAHQSIQTAVELMRSLEKGNPGNLENQYSLALYNMNLGNVRRKLTDLDGAITAYRNAAEIEEQLVRKNPAVSAYKLSLALCYSNLGAAQSVVGKTDESVDSLTKSADVARQLSQDQPDVPAYQDRLASSYDRLGVAYAKTGAPAQAVEAFRQAMAIQQKLTQEHPSVPEYLNELAGIQHNLSNVLRHAGKRSEAITLRESEAEILKSLVKDYPDVVDYQESLAGALENSAWDHEPDNDKVIGVFLNALDVRERLVQRNPGSDRFQHELANCLNTLGVAQGSSGDCDAATTSFLRALKICQKLVVGHPRDADFLRTHYYSFTNLPRACRGSERLDEVEAEYNRSLQIVETIRREHPEVSAAGAQLGTLHCTAGRMWRDAGKYNEAVAAYRNAVKAELSCVDENPEDSEHQTHLNTFVDELGKLLCQLKRHDEAAEAYRQVLDEQLRLIRQFPTNKVSTRLIDFRGGLLSALMNGERPQDVNEFFQDQLLTWKQLESECDDKVGCSLQRADLHRCFADWLRAANQATEAEAHIRMAIESARTAVQMAAESKTSPDVWSRLGRLLDQIEDGGTFSLLEAEEVKAIRHNVEQLAHGNEGAPNQ